MPETETSRAETGRDQEYVVQGRTDQIRTYMQKIKNLHLKLMHGIIASSQRTVLTERHAKNSTKNLEQATNKTKTIFWTYCVTLNKTPDPDLPIFKWTRGVVERDSVGWHPSNEQVSGVDAIAIASPPNQVRWPPNL
jgi:hypothetical protein